MEKKPPYYDKIGIMIRRNSVIAYGHSLGRCAALKIGRVIAIAPVPEHGNGDARLTVLGVEENCRMTDGKLVHFLELSKKGTLQFPDRCIVLPRSVVPKEYSEILFTPELNEEYGDMET